MIYADITEFVSNPIGTGIQRTVREIFAHWPEGLAAAYFDGTTLRTLPHDAYVAVMDGKGSASDNAAKAAKIVAANPGEILGPETYILIPEVFYDHARCDFYDARIADQPSRTFALVYDVLPWTHPDLFGIKNMVVFERYFQLIFAMAYTAHISVETRQAYERCMFKERHWPLPVVNLGADGLSIERQHFSPSRRSFVSLGSIEARKGQQVILHAFEQLWDEGIDAPLVLIGKLTEHTSPNLVQGIQNALVKYPQFKHYERASDTDIAKILSTARATIAASTVEGYGLPALESLYASIPVIVSDTMPSTNRLANEGQIRFDPKRPHGIVDAVKTMLDDQEAERLWAEAERIDLPTWRGAALQVHNWATGVWATHIKIDRKLKNGPHASADRYLSEIAL